MPKLIRLMSHNYYSNAEKFLAAVKEQNLDAKDTVFVFPSNAKDGNKKKKGLYDRYSDKKTVRQKGVLRTASVLADVGMPTLDLPTVGLNPMEKEDLETPQEAQKAVTDLWKAAGFGKNIVIAAASRIEKIVDEGAESKEISTSNPREDDDLQNKDLLLASYYTAQMALLGDFLGSEKKLEDFQVDVFVPNDNGREPTRGKRNFTETYPELAAAFKAGEAAKENLAANSRTVESETPSTQLEVDKWFLPKASKTEVDSNITQLYNQQEKDRRWKTAKAILISIFSLGILAVWAYRQWKKEKDEELIQPVEMKPVTMAALSEYRREVLAASKTDLGEDPATKDISELEMAQGKPKRAFASHQDKAHAEQSPDSPVTFLVTKHHAQYLGLFSNAMQKNITKLDATTYDTVAKLSSARATEDKQKLSLSFSRRGEASSA